MNLLETGFLIFIGGLFGMIVSFLRHNIIIFFLTTEIMFLGSITTLVIFGNYIFNPNIQVNALLILTLAAIETAIGLCILVQAKDFIEKLSFNSFHTLNG